ncbi:uncharacterized protein L969DRAFT_14435 [Mixia osmundae IAM 14324]|nr:uncharacterized protein L969DRAFT_14435 [Mixia osmundae IAM 14324]KEI42231.1 hypothetical protein L969DRAFT_14435 [Mixia osmundae IAM 14324]
MGPPSLPFTSSNLSLFSSRAGSSQFGKVQSRSLPASPNPGRPTRPNSLSAHSSPVTQASGEFGLSSSFPSRQTGTAGLVLFASVPASPATGSSPSMPSVSYQSALPPAIAGDAAACMPPPEPRSQSARLSQPPTSPMQSMNSPVSDRDLFKAPQSPMTSRVHTSRASPFTAPNFNAQVSGPHSSYMSGTRGETALKSPVPVRPPLESVSSIVAEHLDDGSRATPPPFLGLSTHRGPSSSSSMSTASFATTSSAQSSDSLRSHSSASTAATSLSSSSIPTFNDLKLEQMPLDTPNDSLAPIESPEIPRAVSPATSLASATSKSEPQASTDAASPSDPRRKHACTFSGCTKAFTTSGHLARHSRIHTGEKRYECLLPGCGARFSRQDNMLQHYRTHLTGKARRTSSHNRALAAAAKSAAPPMGHYDMNYSHMSNPSLPMLEPSSNLAPMPQFYGSTGPEGSLPPLLGRPIPPMYDTPMDTRQDALPPVFNDMGYPTRLNLPSTSHFAVHQLLTEPERKRSPIPAANSPYLDQSGFGGPYGYSAALNNQQAQQYLRQVEPMTSADHLYDRPRQYYDHQNLPLVPPPHSQSPGEFSRTTDPMRYAYDPRHQQGQGLGGAIR